MEYAAGHGNTLYGLMRVAALGLLAFGVCNIASAVGRADRPDVKGTPRTTMSSSAFCLCAKATQSNKELPGYLKCFRVRPRNVRPASFFAKAGAKGRTPCQLGQSFS